MKNLLIILLLAIAAAGCKKNHDCVETPQCSISDEVRARYTESAMQLMMQRYLADTSLPEFHNAILSVTERYKILGYIQSVYNLRTPERDTVFDIFRIEAFPVVNLHSIIMQVDTAAPEIKLLLSGQPSGNPALDALLSNYGLDSFSTAYSYPRFNWVTAFTDQSLNTIQVAKELRAFPFIYTAEQNGYVGDGDRMALKVIPTLVPPSILALDFSIGRMDCPAGCIYRRHWVFQVDSNCSARFMESYEGR